MVGISEDPLIGGRVAGYRIDGFVGSGGMGRVYRATQLKLERTVALKLLAHDAVRDPEYRERFRRESLIAASVEHPNVIPVIEADEDGDLLFIAMRHVQGTDLGRELRSRGALPAPRAVDLARQVAAALTAAHARGLVHRDVKPGNILIAGDHVYLTDFGIAIAPGRRDDGGDHDRHARLHGARAMPGRCDRSAHGRLRARLRALRDAHGRGPVRPARRHRAHRGPSVRGAACALAVARRPPARARRSDRQGTRQAARAALCLRRGLGRRRRCGARRDRRAGRPDRALAAPAPGHRLHRPRAGAGRRSGAAGRRRGSPADAARDPVAPARRGSRWRRPHAASGGSPTAPAR